jgi:hypothetical protein
VKASLPPTSEDRFAVRLHDVEVSVLLSFLGRRDFAAARQASSHWQRASLLASAWRESIPTTLAQLDGQSAGDADRRHVPVRLGLQWLAADLQRLRSPA